MLINNVGSFVLRTELLSSGGNENPNYSGAVMVFQQTSAPTGWVKLTTDNDAILTTTTSTPTTGGLTAFSTIFGSSVSVSATVDFPTLTVDPTTLLSTQLPPHTHSYTYRPPSPAGVRTVPTAPPLTLKFQGLIFKGGTESAGLGDSHSHPAPAGASTSTPFITKDLRVKYVDVILASFT